MLSKVNWSKTKSYRSGGVHEPMQFYLDALCNSNSFDLLLGYFSSSAINVLSLGFANFIYRGGKMRAVINNVLSEEDKKAIIRGQNLEVNSTLYDFNDLHQLRSSLDDYGRHFFECFAWLIANRRIELKIIKPKERKGIAHYKSGVFSDGEQSVSFKSSCNFTYYGFVENLEELDCRLSWNQGDDENIKEQQQYFEELFGGNSQIAEYIDPEQITSVIANEFNNKNLEELIIQEKELIDSKRKTFGNQKVLAAIKRAEDQLEEILRIEKLPKFPYPNGPRDYQKRAYQEWVKNGHKGLFAMATGTGKTLTSLNCLLNLYVQSGSYKAVIAVPTIALVDQWVKECRKFNFNNIITISSKSKWPRNVSFLNSASNFIDVSFVIIVTYATFYREKFQLHFRNLPSNTLFIADEAHNLGSKNLAKSLPSIHLQKRIGLSATPDRKYDQLGNQSIESFFNDRPPFIFSYSMKQAMDKGWLSQYKYYPHIVRLTDIELEQYQIKSRQLAKFFDPVTKKYKDCIEVERLLLERKRIIHKAANKLPIFQEILEEEFDKKGNLNYTLIYVPEGVEANYEETDESVEDNEDISLIDQYTRVVSRTDSSIMVKQYTANTKNRDEVIDNFQKGEIHVLTSMKCLDEGVDVPRSELAIFCASTGNPRQFIQRRGRVLRTHADKPFAVIHDLVVAPEVNDETTFEMEKSIIKKELERVVDFSTLALNKPDTYESLRPILSYYNIHLYEDQTKEIN